jgi:hypothetical protein
MTMALMPSPKREAELERLLRRLRERCFESDRAARLIHVVKARLAPAWDERAAVWAAKRSERLLSLYA